MQHLTCTLLYTDSAIQNEKFGYWCHLRSRVYALCRRSFLCLTWVICAAQRRLIAVCDLAFCRSEKVVISRDNKAKENAL